MLQTFSSDMHLKLKVFISTVLILLRAAFSFVISRQCPDGSIPAVYPINCTVGFNQCPIGYSCQNELCCQMITANNSGAVRLQPCNKLQQNPCPDGKIPDGTCFNSVCRPGFTCVQPANICCPFVPPILGCPNNQPSLGLCVNDLCPVRYTCQNNQCCPEAPSPPIIPNLCADGSFALQTPTSCLQAFAVCPVGYACSTNGLCCREQHSPTICPNSKPPQGPCINGFCPIGATCIQPQNLCCQDGNTNNGATVCPNGFTSAGQCDSGKCPSNFGCNFALNLCCP